MNTLTRTVEIPSRSVPLRHDVDVIVAGGGASGIAAAVAASRAGSSVLLVERHGFLGGTMTAATLGGICGLYSLVDGKPVQLVFGLADEVRRGLERGGGTTGPKPWLKTASLPYDPFVLHSVFEELIRIPRLTLLLHCAVEGLITDDGRVRDLILRGPEGLFAARAGVVIDCSGDAHVCDLAGNATDFAPEEIQMPSAMFRMGGVETELVAGMPRDALQSHLERAVEAGFDLPRTTGGIYSIRPGLVHLNITKISLGGRAPNPFDSRELTLAEIEGRRQAGLYLEAFRRFVPGFEKAYVLDTGCEIGIRESRKIVGDYRISAEDVASERKFADAVAANCWPVEEHGAGRTTHWGWLSPGGYCHIPYASLVPRDLRNVLVAGRCLSASHSAQASLRVTANCFAMGQAAGIAASLASGGDVRSVGIARLQQALAAEGVRLNPTC